MTQTSRPHVQLFTDGACSGNPGPGGWAFLLRHPSSGKERSDSGANTNTTNNRMELSAVIHGLSALTSPSEVDLFSDSKYVLDGLKSWIYNWKRNGWKTAAKKPVKNADLWQQLESLRQTHTITFHWVKGHAGHPENEFVDKLAVEARDSAAQSRS